MLKVNIKLKNIKSLILNKMTIWLELNYRKHRLIFVA